MIPVPLLATPLAKYLVGLAVIVLVAGGLYIKGRSDGSLVAQAEIAKEHAEERKQWQNDMQKIINDVVTERKLWQQQVFAMKDEFVASTEQIFKDYMKGVTVTREVVRQVRTPQIIERYVPSPANEKCTIPNGFVELHNKAANNVGVKQIESVDSANVGGDSGRKLTGVVQVVSENYLECNITREQLIALQKSVQEFQAKQKQLIEKADREAAKK